ncbi:hypothetical protein GCM10009037_24070 [Halarchaeum grantii]|uniref:SHOCT domain-containing protein n=1 Tax=Halarchaeum grantii TaxID=1193105 RepID=A0A830F4X6_9EURY|nr:hypothetical protein [Halarchaeum grantii]GGL39483.1 hypothetical protein GCM10009037_24070 [Halarchaeum grantii]
MADTRPTDGTLRTLLLVLAAIVVAPLLVMAVAVPMMGLYGGMMDGSGGMMGAYGGMTGGYSPLWGIGPLLVFLVVLAVLAYVAYRALAGRQATDPALAELRLAYARGDLSDEEYASRRETLREDDRRE